MNKERFRNWMDVTDEQIDNYGHHIEEKCPFTNTCKLKENNQLVLNCAIFQHKFMQIIGKKHD